MSVIIRNQGFSYIWTCKMQVSKSGKMSPCNYMEVAESEEAAKSAYGRHKKTTKGH